MLLSVFTLNFTSCKEEEIVYCETFATVLDQTGLDGCRWIIRTEDGKFIEPVWEGNDFQNAKINGVQLSDGLEVQINYTLRTDLASICMVGQIAEITCIFSRSDLVN